MNLQNTVRLWQGGNGPQKIKIDRAKWYVVDQHIEQTNGPIVSEWTTREDAVRAASGRPFSRVVSGKALARVIRVG